MVRAMRDELRPKKRPVIELTEGQYDLLMMLKLDIEHGGQG